MFYCYLFLTVAVIECFGDGSCCLAGLIGLEGNHQEKRQAPVHGWEVTGRQLMEEPVTRCHLRLALISSGLQATELSVNHTDGGSGLFFSWLCCIMYPKSVARNSSHSSYLSVLLFLLRKVNLFKSQIVTSLNFKHSRVTVPWCCSCIVLHWSLYYSESVERLERSTTTEGPKRAILKHWSTCMYICMHTHT